MQNWSCCPASLSHLSIAKLILQVRPSGWMRRIMWAVALMAMMGSCFTMGVLWGLYALVRPTALKSKDATKGTKLGLSDEEISSEEGASDVASGDLACSSEYRDPAHRQLEEPLHLLLLCKHQK